MAAEFGNQSVERAIAVLSAFSDGRSLRVSEVAQRAGLGQSTTSRLLATLEALDFVDRDPVSSLYRMGPAVVPLAGVALNQHPVHRAARQPAQELAAALGLGVNVSVRRGDSLFYLCNFEGRAAPRSFVLIGQRNPLHATGMGKCLLLALSAQERRALLPDLHGYTPTTVTSHDELDEVIASVRHKGYAVEREELALGRACVAAPILDDSGDVVAALSISGPLSAINLHDREHELSRMAIEVADSISISLGYMGPAAPFTEVHTT